MQTLGRWEITWAEKTESTSLWIKSHMDDLPSPYVFAALEQSAGRGQGDHKWHSAAGENLTFSIFVRYSEAMPLDAAAQQILTMASSLSVVDFLAEYGIHASIKKPNDIYVDGKKICGMLIENGLRSGRMGWSIIGMGIDINEEQFPLDLPNPVSLSQLTGKKYELHETLEKYLGFFSQRFESIWTDPDGLEISYDSLVLKQQ